MLRSLRASKAQLCARMPTTLLASLHAGEAEREEIAAELKRVRDEFDALKWKGRWSG